MTNLINVFLILIFVFYGYLLMKKYKFKFMLIFLLYTNSLWKLISLAYIETGIYIIEQDRYSFYLGATIDYFIYSSIFLYVLYKFLDFKEVKCYNYNLNLKIIKILIVIALIMMYLNLILTGVPLINSKIDRFNFEEFSKFMLGFKMYTYFTTYSFYLGLIVIKNKKNKTAWILYFIILLYGILIKQKFSYFYFSIPMFLFGYSINNQMKLKKILKTLVFVILGCLILTSLEYSKYKSLGNSLLEKIVNRVLGLQSHVLWGVQNLKNEGLEIELLKQLKYEFLYIFGEKIYKNETSLYKIMSLISPKDYVEKYFAANIRFAGDYIATLNFMFNKISVIILVIFIAYFIAKVLNKIYFYSKKGNYVILFFYLQVFLISYQFLAMGVIIDLFTKRFIFSLIIIFIFEIIYLLYKNSKRSFFIIQGVKL